MRLASLSWVAVPAALIQLSCSALVDSSSVQCRSDADCARLGSGYGTCSSQGVCLADGAPSTGTDTPLGPPGCFRGTPGSDLDFFNQCTHAQYLRFDNC